MAPQPAITNPYLGPRTTKGLRTIVIFDAFALRAMLRPFGKFVPAMRQQHPLPKTLLWALAALFSGLLLSSAVLPTVMSVAVGKAIAAPAPVEEEQLHGREVLKHALHDHGAWDGNALQFNERVQASFRDRDEALPDGPISDVPLQPPKGA